MSGKTTCGLKYGPCANKLFSAVIEILNELTDEKWGFVQWRRKVSYVSSVGINIKFGSPGTKNADYCIKTRTNDPAWKQSLRSEISSVLVEYSRKNPSINVKNLIDNKIITDDFCNDISLDNCKEFNAYQSTFIHAPTDWIMRETIILDNAKVLSRDDYM